MLSYMLRCCPSQSRMLSLMGSKTTMQSQGPYAAAPQRPVNTETYHIILPLSLVRRPGPGAELKELDPPKRLGKQVRKLVLGVDVARLDAPFKQPRMTWHLTQMCLLRSWKTGFFARARADLLSTLSSTALVSLPRRSPSSRASQSA